MGMCNHPDDNTNDDDLDENNNTNAGKDDNEEDDDKMEGTESSVAAFICIMGAAVEVDKEAAAAMGYSNSIHCNNIPFVGATLNKAMTPSISKTTDVNKLPLSMESLKMSYFYQKYLLELEFMLHKFCKLEQLLNRAKAFSDVPSTKVKEKSAGSREHREKLHSFILHMEWEMKVCTQRVNLFC
eukprot:10241157-Ditylum_brightwellii.AAC.1